MHVATKTKLQLKLKCYILKQHCTCSCVKEFYLINNDFDNDFKIFAFYIGVGAVPAG